MQKIILLLLVIITQPSLEARSTNSMGAWNKSILLAAADTLPFNQEKKLTGVTVKSERPFVEMQVDKMVLNVSGDLVASGGNLLEVVQRAPGVSVTNEESINMSGKSGVTILIDGRPTQLAGKELVNYLRTIPGSLVDRVEIISNPSAKYDAQGNAGVINIRMKRITVRGTNGNIGAAWTQSRHARKNLSGMVNRRSGKWNLNANGALGRANQFTDGGIVRQVASGAAVKTFSNSTVDQDASRNYNLQLGLDWFTRPGHSFGAIIKTNGYNNPMYTPGVTLISSNGVTDSSLQTINDNRSREYRNNYNLNYRYEDTSGTVFNVDADHTSFRNTKSSLVETDLVNGAGSKYGFTANDQRVLTKIKIYSLKADFTRVFRPVGITVEAGARWNHTQTNNKLDAFYLANNSMRADSGRTNEFDYRETMYAGYVSVTRIKAKWQYQLGLRGERTIIHGVNTDLAKKRLAYPDSSYFNLFPSAFLRYQVSPENSVGISYSRRLNRPGYQDLNPFEYIFDNYTRESGNPYLQPEFSQRIELSLSLGSGLNLSAGISRTTNLMESVSRQFGEVTIESDFNIGRARQAFANVSFNKQLFKWWNLYASLSPFYKKYDAALPEGIIDAGTWGMGWYANNSFSAGHGWKLQLSSWGNIATQDGLYHTSGLGSVDAAAGKTILRERLNLRLAVIDIFNTQRWKQQVDFADVHFVYQRKWESRGVRLQLTWKFGKSAYRARERSTGIEEEANRIKSKD
ncbi:MAG: TonB-dependent receptor [Chitinophagaceae bacterium]|nr:MAG: TonB-dependent receptor [Chitinophagaceae bacterium]